MYEMSTTPLYWQGNSAKTRIIADLIERANGRESVVFDYGCGGAGDWPRVLEDNPHLRLLAYEPHMPSFQLACNRLRGRNAEIFTGDRIAKLSFKADYIVSFSVFEHVFDRPTFLANAHRLLARDGLFYLNYDDGHFRNLIDLAEPERWFGSVRVWLHNLLARPLALIGNVSSFQQRVTSDDFNQMVLEMGFEVEHEEYHNLICFKDMFKDMDPALQLDFSSFWLRVEAELNARFRCHMATAKKGDRVNLWQQMVSRTFWLRHAGNASD